MYARIGGAQWVDTHLEENWVCGIHMYGSNGVKQMWAREEE